MPTQATASNLLFYDIFAPTKNSSFEVSDEVITCGLGPTPHQKLWLRLCIELIFFLIPTALSINKFISFDKDNTVFHFSAIEDINLTLIIDAYSSNQLPCIIEISLYHIRSSCFHF